MRPLIHYGPWRVTVTDGDTASHHEVYASNEQEAIEIAVERTLDTHLTSDATVDSHVTYLAQRLS